MSVGVATSVRRTRVVWLLTASDAGVCTMTRNCYVSKGAFVDPRSALGQRKNQAARLRSIRGHVNFNLGDDGIRIVAALRVPSVAWVAYNPRHQHGTLGHLTRDAYLRQRQAVRDAEEVAFSSSERSRQATNVKDHTRVYAGSTEDPVADGSGDRRLIVLK